MLLHETIIHDDDGGHPTRADGPDGADLRSLIGRADEYLYNAKDAGRNRIISSDSVLVPCQA